MESVSSRPRERESIMGLISGLREDVRNLVHEEIQLAKTEVSEKVSVLSRNAVTLAIGGVAAFFGASFLLLAIALIIAYGFEELGLSSGMALFLGFIIVAVLTGVIGGALVSKALSGFSKTTLVPEKTVQTLQAIKEGGLEQVPIKTYPVQEEPKDTRTSGQIQADVERTRSRIGREVRGLKTRLSVANMATRLTSAVKNNPVRSVSIGVGTGLAGYAIMRLARLFGRRRLA
jgi:hypothetical protein